MREPPRASEPTEPTEAMSQPSSSPHRSDPPIDPPPDPRDPTTWARLQQRTNTGAYVIAEAEVVRAIRFWRAQGASDRVESLLEVLVVRCMPEFRRHSAGLHHRPDLREEAISGMTEQLLREAQDPREAFMLANFIHYLRCLCMDNFQRVLRQEGLRYRKDERGHPLGRGNHVPRILIDRIDVPRADDEDDGLDDGPAHELAASDDPLRARLSSIGALQLLNLLADPLDRQIFMLRALDEMRWRDIAAVVGNGERFVRIRYEAARKQLRAAIIAAITEGRPLDQNQDQEQPMEESLASHVSATATAATAANAAAAAVSAQGSDPEAQQLPRRLEDRPGRNESRLRGSPETARDRQVPHKMRAHSQRIPKAQRRKNRKRSAKKLAKAQRRKNRKRSARGSGR